MSGPDDTAPPVSEQEIARILQRAAVLQERDRQRGAVSCDISRGISLAELKQIAREVGIAPRYVEAAAAELDSKDESRKRFSFWGAPVSSELEQTVEGELPVEEWDRLVTRIRRCTGNVGRTSSLGRSLEWTGQADHVSISPREGRTTIRILSGHDTTAAAHASALIAGFFALMPIIGWLHGVPLEAAGLYAMTAGGLFGLARVWARAMFRGHRRKMEALLQELADHAAQAAAPASLEPSRSQPSVASDAPATEALSLGVSEHTHA